MNYLHLLNIGAYKLKILVTGAAGFIGYHTSLRLLDRGDTVIGLDNLNDYYDPQLKLDRLAKLKENENFSFYRENAGTLCHRQNRRHQPTTTRRNPRKIRCWKERTVRDNPARY